MITRFVASRPISGTTLTDKGACEAITIDFHGRFSDLKQTVIAVINSVPRSRRDF
jgi:hypothetical protein